MCGESNFKLCGFPRCSILRRDPFERADEHSNTYNDWWVRTALPRLTMARVQLQGFLETLKVYPPRQRPATFTIDQLMEQLYERAE